MITLLLIILFCFIKSPLSLNIYQFLQEGDGSSEEIGQEFLHKLLNKCIYNYIDNINNLTNCLIIEVKYDVEGLYHLLENPSLYEEYLILIPQNEIGEIIRFITALLGQDARNRSELIGLIINSINCTEPGEPNVLDYVLDLINIKELDYGYIFKIMSKLFQNEYINNILDYLYNYHFDNVMKILKKITEYDSELEEIYNLVTENFSDKELKELVELIYKVIQLYEDKVKVLRLFEDYFMKIKPEMLPKFKNVILSEQLKMIFKGLIEFKTEYLNAMKDVIFERPEILDILFGLTTHKTLLHDLADIIINYENETFFNEHFVNYLVKLKAIDNSYIDKIAKVIFYIAEYSYRYEAFTSVVLAAIQKFLKNFLLEGSIFSYDISPDCMHLFNHAFLENSDLDPIFLNYLKKLIMDSPMNSGGFLNYENCLSIGEEVKMLDKSKNPFNIKPAFVICMVENRYSRLTFKNTSFYEKYYYITSFCLPYGFKLNSTEEMCDENDYNEIMKFISYFYSNYTNLTVESKVLYEDNISLTSYENFVGYLAIIFFCIPFIIRIFLFGIDFCQTKNKKNKKINKLISTKDKGKDKTGIIPIEYEKEKDNIVNKKKEGSKCYKILKESHSFIKNFSELFNFNIDRNNFNNTKGITYLKGLIGLSIIFNIFGQNFIILFNLPMKQFGLEDFHSSLTNWTFPLIFIGYRYTPRILFSCSGYTLIYKYLCYIEQEGGYYFLKFVFLQSYKYIFLYLILFLFAYTFKYIIFFLMQTKRPIWTLFTHYLEKDKSFFFKSFTFLLFDFLKELTNQNPINFFYMPINETFFFIIGTALISLGYKYKWRIDLIIIGAIIFLFTLKLIMYLFVVYPNMKLYSTTDYYNNDFGLALINPLYNLSSFLIGMYFGLINYSIQKGITQVYKTTKDYYKNIIPLKNSDEEQEKINISKDIMIQSINEDLKEQKNNDINEVNNENLEKIISKENININNKENKEYSEKIKNMPFLISPINFINLNRKHKDKISFNILIIIVLLFFIFLIYSKKIFISLFSDIDFDLVQKEYITRLSLVKTIANDGLKILYLLDIEIVVFLVQWIIFLLFFKETQIIRNFFNNMFWSFFVKCYYPYILLSGSIILIIFYQTESVIKVHTYNIIFFSMINIIIVFIVVIIYYVCYELPVKKIFKYFLKGDEIIEEENDDEDEDEKDQEEENEEQWLENYDDEDENQFLKQDNKS